MKINILSIFCELIMKGEIIMSIKNKKLRNTTEGYLGIVNSFEEYYLIGNELENVGKLIKDMASHMENLQDKVNSQAAEIRRLSGQNEETKEEKTTKTFGMEDLIKNLEAKGFEVKTNSEVKREETPEEVEPKLSNREILEQILNGFKEPKVRPEPKVKEVDPFLELLSKAKVKPYTEEEKIKAETMLKEFLRNTERVENIKPEPRVEYIKSGVKTPNPIFELFPGMIIGLDTKRPNKEEMEEFKRFLEIFRLK